MLGLLAAAPGDDVLPGFLPDMALGPLMLAVRIHERRAVVC